MPQGTVKSHHPETFETVIVTDDLVEHVIPSGTFEAAHLLELRIGQRIRFEFTDGDDGPTITNLGIVSM